MFEQLFSLFGVRDPEPVRKIVLPASDDDAASDSTDSVQPLDGQCFMIEYRDSAGRSSCRRIVALNYKRGPSGDWLLGAQCLERKAYRTFRVDRIDCCIDLDGEVFETRHFLQTYVDEALVCADPQSGINQDRIRRMRAVVRPHAQLMAALSRADGYMHPAELGVARLHAERLVEPERPSLDECNIFYRPFERLRPRHEHIRSALSDLRRRPVNEQMLFFRAAGDLIAADGQIHPLETELLNSLAIELTGVSATG
tara:strand:- start:510 stop:1274 length:765 start_codon:yes stop_codon:yes gene_type:complete